MCNPTTRQRPFNYEGRHLEVKAECNNEGWKVQVYENGKPATYCVYCVSYEDFMDANTVLSSDLVEELMNIAQDDIQRGVVTFRPLGQGSDG